MITKKTATLTPAAASRQALAEAEAKRGEWQALYADAGAAVEELLGRLAEGDDGVTADAWTQAKALREIAAELVKAGDARVKRAEAGLINDDTKVADLLAAVLAQLFGDKVPVRVVAVRREVVAPESAEPVLYVLQEKPGKDNGGLLSGELTVTYYRPELFAPLAAERVRQACQTLGYVVEIAPAQSTRRGPVQEDRVVVRVRQAAAEAPSLTAPPTEAKVRHFALGLSGRIGSAVKAADPNPGIRLMGEAPTPGATSEITGHRIVSTEDGPDGDRRMTVEVLARVKPSPYLRANPHPLLRAAVEDCAGVVEAGLGRVIAAEAVEISTPDREGPGINRPWTVTARFVIAYAVAK